jgi:DNA-directed RNA polymerase subunit RPC12/RpoP
MNICLDCGKEIGPNAERCASHAATFRNLNGGGNFKDGHTLNRVCIDCGKPITKQAIRCLDCSKKILIQRMKENAHLYNSKQEEPTHKICGRCQKDLPVSEFHKHNKDYFQPDCKKCQVKTYKQYVEVHREEIKKYQIEWNHRTGRSNFYGQGKRPKLNRPIRFGVKGNSYPFNWNEIRAKIYQRDNWTCQDCGCKCHTKGQIQCHHIDYNTENNLEINLITLCNRCHAITSVTNKDFFIWYYENKILLIYDKIKNVVTY